MALLNPYATVAQVRTELRNSGTAAPSGITDAEIEDAINATSRWMEEYKGRDWLFHDHSVTPLQVGSHSGAIHGRRLFLPYAPIITLTAVTVAEEAWGLGTDYIQENSGTLLAVARETWPVSDYVYGWTELTGTFGYVQASGTVPPTGLPANVNRACVLAAARLSGKNTKDVRGLDGMPVSILDMKLPHEVYELLGYRKCMV